MGTDTTGRSGIHLSGTDSGWPTGAEVLEPDPHKDGSGGDDASLPRVRSTAGGVVTYDDDAQPPVDPSSIDDLVLWLKADTISLDDGAAVAGWPESVAELEVAQAVGEAQPLYRADVLNGLPGVHFDGVDDRLVITGNAPSEDTADGQLQGDVTLFAVVKSEAQPAVDGYAPIIMATNGPGLYWGAVDLGHSDAEYFASAAAIFGGSYLIANGSGVDGVPYLITVQDAGATGVIRRGGLDVTDPLYQGTDPTNWTPTWIGCDDGPHAFTGFIHEILIYSAALDDENRQAVEAYLSGKWGIPTP